MKAIILIISMFVCAKLTAPPYTGAAVIIQEQAINNYDAIWEAVCQVESGGNPYAVNYEKGGYSVGLAQIRQVRIDHYNRLTGANYTLDDCFSLEVSKEVFMYFAHRIGNEDRLIRAWNGSGPQTIEYLKKVKSCL